jgi:hypothetical protein
LVHSLQGALKFNELSNAIIHLFHSFVLREAHTPLIGDVIHTTLSLCVFTACATDLLTFKACNGELVLSKSIIRINMEKRSENE